MSDVRVKVIIPFRDRGIDPRRSANLDVVQAWWYAHKFEPAIVDDGLVGDQQFNRHRAYNRAVARFPNTQVFIFAEADMLIHPTQVRIAVNKAAESPGLVVPFTQYRYLSDSMTDILRDDYRDSGPEKLSEFWKRQPGSNSIFDLSAESIMDNGRSIGAVNVISRETLEATGGFTELTSGNWYDDNITKEGFEFLVGKTRFVTGPAVHLYHLPGHKGEHLTGPDKLATANNKLVLDRLRHYIKENDATAVKSLLSHRKGVIPRQ